MNQTKMMAQLMTLVKHRKDHQIASGIQVRYRYLNSILILYIILIVINLHFIKRNCFNFRFTGKHFSLGTRIFHSNFKHNCTCAFIDI